MRLLCTTATDHRVKLDKEAWEFRGERLQLSGAWRNPLSGEKGMLGIKEVTNGLFSSREIIRVLDF